MLGQALIQLKFGRLQHYLQWTNPQDVSQIELLLLDCVEPGPGAVANYTHLRLAVIPPKSFVPRCSYSHIDTPIGLRVQSRRLLQQP